MKQMIWCMLVSCLCLGASNASAQVRQGSFKIGLESNVFSWSVDRVEAGGNEVKLKTLAFGPANNSHAGWNLNYVAIPHLILGAYLGFDRIKNRSDPGGTDKTGFVEFRPQLEIPFNPRDRVVLAALLAFDYVHSTHNNSESNGIGPAFGLVAHAFVMPAASLDLGATFRYLSFDDKDAPRNVDHSSLAIMFTAGLSLWP